MKDKFKRVHMQVAEQYARLPRAERRQVGCVIVINDIVVPGYNGTPTGWDNHCETADGSATLPEVIHAEQNALDKIIRSTMSSEGASVFVTTAPCIECAKRLLGARVKEVFYRDVYRNEDWLDFLVRGGVQVERICDEIDK
jgi:dCMP deaminase